MNNDKRFPSPVSDDLHVALLAAISRRAAELGWSSNRIAKEAGLSKGNWSEINNGKKSPRMSSVAKLCAALDISITFTPTENSND